MVDRFAKLSKGQVFSGLAKDVVKGALNTGKKAIGKVFNFFTGIQPIEAVEMSSKVQNLSNIKEVFLHDNTIMKSKTITEEVQPQETVMGTKKEKPLEYDQDLPIEERKKLYMRWACKPGGTVP